MFRLETVVHSIEQRESIHKDEPALPQCSLGRELM